MAICCVPGCPEEVTSGRCKAHRLGPSQGRGSTRAWRITRQRALDRARDASGVPRCFYCGAEADRGDHYVPVAEGGTDDDRNIVAACTPCNSRKGRQMPDVFLASTWLARRCRDVASGTN